MVLLLAVVVPRLLGPVVAPRLLVSLELVQQRAWGLVLELQLGREQAQQLALILVPKLELAR